MENTVVQYNGFRPPANWKIATIPANTAPEVFFKDYVCTRTPVIINGLITDEKFKGHLWDNEYLIGKAGAAKIKVEQSDPSGNFGSALPRLEMTFKEFLDKISAGDQNLYLTTQYDDDDEEEEEEESKEEEENVDFVKKEVLKQLFAPPSNQLAEDIPFRPALMGNLIPAQFNMWMGNSKAGTSTGLHHDFQDNLYLLLRGEKQFTVICPSEAQNVYTHGQIEKVHPNGYIKYKGVPESRADGAPLADVILNKMSEIEEAIVKLEEEGAETEEMDKLEEQKNELISQLEKAHGDLGEEDEDEDEDEEEEDDEVQIIRPAEKRKKIE
eukprot:TRINITY_DN2404_c0_g1_i2.p1 TRINITY_DN2404_c0_g1~~TRINITY_DN2404_c0_g1_i2.p1  ORF type:complete len:326 (+),score=96.94 TRINITY_DN2404_c0_g1_i2:32-1009(+)